MASVNKVILIGNLGRDPEMRYTQGGQPVARLSLATTRVYTSRTNERVEETEWHRVTVWGRQAEMCEKYLAKGRQVYVEGRLKTTAYDDKKDGIKRYSTEIVADVVQFLGGRGEGGGGGERPGGRGGPRSDAGFEPEPYDPGGDYLPSPPDDDDIPF